MKELIDTLEQQERGRISENGCLFCDENATDAFWMKDKETYVCKKHHVEVKRIYAEAKIRKIAIDDKTMEQINQLFNR